MKMRSVSIIALMLCTLSFRPSLARAKLVPIAINAEVTEVHDGYAFLEGRVNVGDLITGVYIYDSSIPDLDPEPYSGVYEHRAPPCGVTLTVGGFVFMTDPDNVQFVVLVENDRPSISGLHDAFQLQSYSNLPLFNGVPVLNIQLDLFDRSASALSSDALPTTAPVLDDWESRFVHISGGGWRKLFHIDGRLTSAVLIPEPATFALLGIGTLVLLRSRRATRRNTKDERVIICQFKE